MPDLVIGGRRLHYEWREPVDRQHRAVVYLHDGLGASQGWKDVPVAIARSTGLNTLLYDRWGHGASEARASFAPGFIEAEVPMLAELLDRLGCPAAHIVGHSDGASIALIFASQFPDRVHSVVSVAAHVFVEPATQSSIQGLLDARAAGNLPRWLTKLHGRRAGALLGAWADVWLSAVHARWTIEDYLAGIACPVLVIQGSEDEFGTAKQVESIVRHVPNATSWILPGAGHVPYSVEPREFVRRVSQFLLEREREIV